MSEQKWTKGPWEIAGAVHVYAPGKNGANICTIGEPRASASVGYTELELGSKDSNEAYANAVLVAAAPDLYEACKAMAELKGWNETPPIFATGIQVMAALRRAEGRQ